LKPAQRRRLVRLLLKGRPASPRLPSPIFGPHPRIAELIEQEFGVVDTLLNRSVPEVTPFTVRVISLRINRLRRAKRACSFGLSWISIALAMARAISLCKIAASPMLRS
jgi:hypothetical protein